MFTHFRFDLLGLLDALRIKSGLSGNTSIKREAYMTLFHAELA